MNYKKLSLKYHKQNRAGKIEINITKKCSTQLDLSLAYTPGVAYPCLEIYKQSKNAFIYTNKKNLVGIISNGTAVLGLGDIGALASKPVMEGKSVLFKKFANIDAFDIEIQEKNPDKLIDIIKSLEPTFGGINLEDIKAPECFYIERKLKKTMNIPVFHDDQHGTAIIATAGLINAMYILKKKAANMKLIVSGAGAGALSCIDMFLKLGIRKRNVFVYDSKGLLHKKRQLNKYKKRYAFHNCNIAMKDAIKNADIFLGLSIKNILKPNMLKSMNKNPIVFALANPYPEIDYNIASEIRKDAIIATGRSDYPNQINNVLGFPFIFRGALDCGAKEITENMKMSASKALALIARKKVPVYIKDIYNENLRFGKHYLIPKPFDKRVFIEESFAVLKQAIHDRVNTINIDLKKYKKTLKDIM